MTKKEEYTQAIAKIKDAVKTLDDELAGKLYNSALAGNEILCYLDIDNWLANRLLPSLVQLTGDDYIEALTHALYIAPGLAGTDYGSTRQRDLGQLWTDTARGLLGEIAFKKFLKVRFNIDITLDFSKGPLENYLETDIKRIKYPDGKIIDNKTNVSIKTTKFNGIWLDIPGAQITHSEVFILVKLGIEREHFIGFLKTISFMRDKLLPQALRLGVINEDEAGTLWESLPDFSPIPCYISGFVRQNEFKEETGIKQPKFRKINKRNGKESYLMQCYLGTIRNNIPEKVSNDLKSAEWKYESIGNFTPEQHCIVTTGYLNYTDNDWMDLLIQMQQKETK